MTDQSILQVRFSVRDIKLYDEEAVIQVLSKRGYRAKQLIAPGSEPPPSLATPQTKTSS